MGHGVFIGPGQAGLAAGQFFHGGFGGLVAFSGRAGNVLNPTGQEVGDRDGGRLGRQRRGIARLQLVCQLGSCRQRRRTGVRRADDPVLDAGDGPGKLDLQVIPDFGVQHVHLALRHVVGADPGTIAQYGILGNGLPLLPDLGLWPLHGDSAGPGVAQLKPLSIEVCTGASLQLGNDQAHIADFASCPCGFRGVVPGDGRVGARCLAVGRGAVFRTALGAGATAGIDGAEIRAATVHAVLGIHPVTLLDDAAPAEVRSQVECAAVQHIAHGEVQNADAAPVVESDAAADVLSRCHVVDDLVAGIGGVGKGTPGHGNGTVREPDLAGLAIDLVDQGIGIGVVAGTAVGGGLSGDRLCGKVLQAQGVRNGDGARVIVDVGPENDGLVEYPEFIGRNTALGAPQGWCVLQGGVGASNGNLDGLVVGQAAGGTRGHTDAPSGHGGRVGAVDAGIEHLLVHVDFAAGQVAGVAATAPGAATAIAGGKGAGRPVPLVGCVLWRAPVVQPNGLRIAADVQIDDDGFGRVQLLDALLAVAVGVARQQAHQHAVIEAILAVWTAAFLEGRGLGASRPCCIDYHVVEGCGRDGEGSGECGGGDGCRVDGADFQRGGRHLGVVGGAAQNGGAEQAGAGARGSALVWNAASKGLAV